MAAGHPAVDGDWLVPDWPAPAGVRACFTGRGRSAADGASATPWAHFNLGDHVGDAPAAVAANRARLRADREYVAWLLALGHLILLGLSLVFIYWMI